MASSSQSRGVVSYTLLTGDTSPGSQFAATFRVGTNSAARGSAPQYMLAEGEEGPKAEGRLVWDAGHSSAESPLASVAQVILDVTPEQVKWAVGTSDFISIKPAANSRYRYIKKLEIAASTPSREQDRLLQWDSIEVTFFCDGHGYFETFSSPCLPRVATAPRRPRRGAHAEEDAKNRGFQQLVEICPNDDNVTRVYVRGQVTLRANCSEAARSRVGPDDLQGKVLVFTHISPRRQVADQSSKAPSRP